jgi:hypothetical protein
VVDSLRPLGRRWAAPRRPGRDRRSLKDEVRRSEVGPKAAYRPPSREGGKISTRTRLRDGVSRRVELAAEASGSVLMGVAGVLEDRFGGNERRDPRARAG